MIIYRNQDMQPKALEEELKKAWRQCGIPDLPFPCVYDKNMAKKPQNQGCLDQAEKDYLQGEKQCDAKFPAYDRRACTAAYDQCLQKQQQKKKDYAACQQEVPCAFSQVARDHFACMKLFETQRSKAKGLCEK